MSYQEVCQISDAPKLYLVFTCLKNGAWDSHRSMEHGHLKLYLLELIDIRPLLSK